MPAPRGFRGLGIASTIVDLGTSIFILSSYYDALSVATQVQSGFSSQAQLEQYEEAVAKAAIWVIVKCGWDIAEIIKPFIYTNKYNKALESTLNDVSNQPKLSMNPVIDIKNGIGFSVGIQF